MTVINKKEEKFSGEDVIRFEEDPNLDSFVTIKARNRE